MKIRPTMALLGALTLWIGFASSAAALSVNLDTGVNVQANTGDSASANASTSGQGIVSASQKNTANTSATAPANLMPVFVTQADLSAGMVSPTSANATSVQSTSDLSGYIAARLQDDSNINQIQASGSSVAVSYNEPARILGIFSVNVEATAQVNSDGSVSVSYPWYVFLASTDASNLQASIQDRVKADFGTNFSVQTSAGFSAEVQAKLINDISSVMQTQANAAANASASS